MNHNIENALNELTKLDSWDIQSVLGGVNYITQQAAINTVVRMLPPQPEEGSGLENFTAWEQAMNEAGKAYETHWYDADRGFANPTSARYDETDARLAWGRTLAFLGKHL